MPFTYKNKDNREDKSTENDLDDLELNDQSLFEPVSPSMTDNADDASRPKKKATLRTSAYMSQENLEDSMIDEAYNIIKNVNFQERDENAVYSEYLMFKLRKFDDRKRAEIQHKFNNIIFEAEMEMYNAT